MILQDGTAQSPLVVGAVAHSPATNYARLLGKLCDCPQSSLASIGAALDCLRAKPVECVTQRVPTKLLQLSNSSLLLNSTLVADARLVAAFVDATSARQLDAFEARANASLSRAFEALFAHAPSDTLRPLFAPHGSDLALPLFGSRDLMLGFSQPLLGQPTSDARAPSDEQRAALLPIAEKLRPETQHAGLELSAAFEFAAAFVKSAYKFHAQEITNSIISQYFAQSKLANLSRAVAAGGAQLLEQRAAYSALLELLEDSLVVAPIVKTALLHSNAQLQKLGARFVAHQFAQLLAKVSRELKSQLVPCNNSTSDGRMDTFVDSQLDQLTSLDALQESLNEAQEAGGEESVKSTFLFQLDFASARRKLLAAVSSSTLKVPLQESLDEEGDAELARSFDDLAFDCIFELRGAASRRESLGAALRELVCERVALQMAQFAKTGTLTLRAARDEQHSNDATTVSGATVDAEHFYEGRQSTVELHNQQELSDECSANNASSSSMVSDNVFPSQVGARQRTEVECQLRKLIALATRKTINSSDAKSGKPLAPTFNAFTQRFLSLDSISGGFGADSFASLFARQSRDISDSSQLLSARLEFWFNFVPALNCSTTQPLTASARLRLPNEHSSTLLGLNLHANCNEDDSLASQVQPPLQSDAIAQSKLDAELGGALVFQSTQQLVQRTVALVKRALAEKVRAFLDSHIASCQISDESKSVASKRKSAQTTTIGSRGANLTQLPASEVYNLEVPASPTKQFVSSVNNLVVLALICGLLLVWAASWLVVSLSKRREESRPAQDDAPPTTPQQTAAEPCADSSHFLSQVVGDDDAHDASTVQIVGASNFDDSRASFAQQADNSGWLLQASALLQSAEQPHAYLADPPQQHANSLCVSHSMQALQDVAYLSDCVLPGLEYASFNRKSVGRPNSRRALKKRVQIKDDNNNSSGAGSELFVAGFCPLHSSRSLSTTTNSATLSSADSSLARQQRHAPCADESLLASNAKADGFYVLQVGDALDASSGDVYSRDSLLPIATISGELSKQGSSFFGFNSARNSHQATAELDVLATRQQSKQRDGNKSAFNF